MGAFGAGGEGPGGNGTLFLSVGLFAARPLFCSFSLSLALLVVCVLCRSLVVLSLLCALRFLRAAFKGGGGSCRRQWKSAAPPSRRRGRRVILGIYVFLGIEHLAERGAGGGGRSHEGPFSKNERFFARRVRGRVRFGRLTVECLTVRN